MVKIRMTVGGPVLGLPGFKEIDPTNRNYPGNPTDLSDLAEEGEVLEIQATDVLDFYPIEFRGQILAHWVSRLARGGLMVVGTREIVEVCRQVSLGDVTGFLPLIYGEVGKQRRLSVGTLPQLRSTLSSLGMTPIRSYVNNFVSYVEAIRQ